MSAVSKLEMMGYMTVAVSKPANDLKTQPVAAACLKEYITATGFPGHPLPLELVRACAGGCSVRIASRNSITFDANSARSSTPPLFPATSSIDAK